MQSGKFEREEMKSMKKAVYILMILIMAYMCTGCQSELLFTEITNKECLPYETTIVPLKSVDEMIGAFSVSGERAYISTLDDKSKLQDYIVNMNDWSVTSVKNSELGEDDWCFLRTVDAEGNIVMMVRKNNTVEGMEHSIVVTKFKPDGEILLQKDITSWITQVDFSEGDMGDVVAVKIGKKGDLIIIMKHQVIVLDSEYEKPQYIELDKGTIQSAAYMKNGKVVCGIEQEKNYYLQVCNPENGRWEKQADFNNGDFDQLYDRTLLDGADYDFYYKDEYAIYGFDMKSEEYIKVVDYKQSGITAELGERYYIRPIEGNRMLGLIVPTEGAEFRLYTPREK